MEPSGSPDYISHFLPPYLSFSHALPHCSPESLHAAFWLPRSAESDDSSVCAPESLLLKSADPSRTCGEEEGGTTTSGTDLKAEEITTSGTDLRDSSPSPTSGTPLGSSCPARGGQSTSPSDAAQPGAAPLLPTNSQVGDTGRRGYRRGGVQECMRWGASVVPDKCAVGRYRVCIGDVQECGGAVITPPPSDIILACTHRTL